MSQRTILRTLGLYRSTRHGLQAVCSDAQGIGCTNRWDIPISAAISRLGASASASEVLARARCPACRSAPLWLDTTIEPPPSKIVWFGGAYEPD